MVEKKSTYVLVVSLRNALNGISPFLCGRRVGGGARAVFPLQLPNVTKGLQVEHELTCINNNDIVSS